MNRRTFVSVGAGALAGTTWLSRTSLFAQVSAAPVVETAAGRIRGGLVDGVRIFKGVPYGAPTAPPRRFLPSVKPQPWTGVRDAIALGPRSPQPVRIMVPEMGDTLTGTGPMSEDCLRLNVWTPATGAGRRPVMVWLHGGGFRTGSGGAAMFDGKELARKHDVVVVTINHRLNAFGFLNLGALPGAGRFADSTNLGMRDIVLALEWVRDNIGQFGGNAGNVTVFGQSGGGGKTSMLTAWPSAKGLFHRAIIQSTLSDTAVRALTQEDSVRAAQALLTRLDIKAGDYDALQTLPMERLLEALIGGTGPAGENARDVRPAAGAPAGLAGDLSLRFTPVVDGKWLPAHPYDPVAPSVSADIPLLCGSVETESVPYQGVNDPYWTTNEIDAAALRDRIKRSLRVDDAEAERVIAVYRKNRPSASNMDIATIVASDNGVLRTSEYTIAERKLALGKSPVYMYYFNWYSPLREGRVRCMHCMELPFVFDHVDETRFMIGDGAERQPLADKVSAAWVAFARSGNPNHSGIPAWKPFTTAERATMVFNNTPALVNDPYGEERRLLESIRARSGAAS